MRCSPYSGSGLGYLLGCYIQEQGRRHRVLLTVWKDVFMGLPIPKRLVVVAAMSSTARARQTANLPDDVGPFPRDEPHILLVIRSSSSQFKTPVVPLINHEPFEVTHN